MSRRNIGSGAPWEDVHGYSRAVVHGRHVFVSGTTGSGDDLEAQTVSALDRIEKALHEAGATLADVVRTRCYVVDISRWEEVAAVHRRFFDEVRPASTMVEVSALVTPELLVEIEADALLPE